MNDQMEKAESELICIRCLGDDNLLLATMVYFIFALPARLI